MAEIAAGGKNFPPESPRGLVAKNNRPALELAAKANPRWGEPYFRLAALEIDQRGEDSGSEDGGEAGAADHRILAGAGRGTDGGESIRGCGEILDGGAASRARGRPRANQTDPRGFGRESARHLKRRRRFASRPRAGGGTAAHQGSARRPRFMRRRRRPGRKPRSARIRRRSRWSGGKVRRERNCRGRLHAWIA